MTSFETISVMFSTIAMLTAFYGIQSAIAAKRSALAAEKQAEAAIKQAQHAETQAGSAQDQVRAAEQQVGLMQSTQLLDTIGVAFRIRRETINTLIALNSYNVAALRDQHVADTHQKLAAFSKQLAILEDAPPVFPRNVRALLFEAMQMLNDSRGPYRAPQLAVIERQFDLTVTAMNVHIAAKINQLSE